MAVRVRGVPRSSCQRAPFWGPIFFFPSLKEAAQGMGMGRERVRKARNQGVLLCFHEWGKGWHCCLQKFTDRMPVGPQLWNEYIPKKNRHSERCTLCTRPHSEYAEGRLHRGGSWCDNPDRFGNEKAYSTQCSQVVAHLSTNWA